MKIYGRAALYQGAASRHNSIKFYTGRRYGCALTVDCVADCAVTVMGMMKSAEALLGSVFSVCGRMGELQLLAYETPVINALDRNSLPGQEKPIVRGLEALFGGALYARAL